MHPGGEAPGGFESLAVPTYRGSTVVFPTVAEVRSGWQAHRDGYSYGAYGTPTTRELALRIAEMEGARETFLVPSGQAAIALVHLAFAGAGDHVLLPETAYGTNRDLSADLLRRLGIEVELYRADVGGGIGELLRANTVLVWCESPGSVTMEVQDVPAIVEAAHRRGVRVALDNTYAAGVLFDAFAHGVDVSLQALTKYVGGHGDLLLGSVSVASEAAGERVGDAHRQLGYVAAPDECSLALRGLQTLGVRIEAMERSALRLAKWLAERPVVARVLHPALPSCAGHALWRRDFTGSASLFSVVFAERVSEGAVAAFVDSLRLFRLGWSWGGTASLVSVYPEMAAGMGGQVVRFHVGLERVEDLMEDVEQALRTLE